MVSACVRQKVALLVLLVLFPFFFWGGMNGNAGRIEQGVWDMGHFVFFAAMAYLLEDFLSSKIKNATLRLVFVMAVVVGGAAGVESIQFFLPGRHSSSGDFYLGAAGSFTVLCLLGSFRVRSLQRFVFLGVAAFTLLLSISPLLLAAYDEQAARRDFPLLSGFESSLEISRWGNCREIKRVSKPVKTGKYAMRITLPPGKYPGVTLLHFPRDWSRARTLRFAVYSPDPGALLNFRVNDSWHEQMEQEYDDRFHGTQLLNRGWNTVNIDMKAVQEAPTIRSTDLSRIKHFRIFLVDNDRERYLYVDDVRLIMNE